jgi:hypothetical protein
MGLAEVRHEQLDLFGASFRIERMERLFTCVDAIKAKYGKHTLFLGSSFLAHKHAQHEGARGTLPERWQALFKGETKRKQLVHSQVHFVAYDFCRRSQICGLF